MNNYNNTKYCNTCGIPVSPEANVCPNCGAHIYNPANQVQNGYNYQQTYNYANNSPQGGFQFDASQGFDGGLGVPAQTIPPMTPQQEPKKKNMMPLIIAAVVLVIAVVFAVLCITHVICLKHDWKEADCTTPKTCSYCGKVEGDVADHSWKKATCTKPKTCKVCEKTEGEALGHDWEENSCTEDSVCTRCDETKEASGHKEGDWVIETEAALGSDGKKVKKCKECGEILDTLTYFLTSHHNNDEFVFTVNEFGTHFNEILEDISYYLYAGVLSDSNSDALVAVYDYYDNNIAVMHMYYSYNDSEPIDFSDADSAKTASMLIGIDNQTDGDDAVAVYAALIMACDPTISEEYAYEILIYLMEEWQNTNSEVVYSYNGLQYVFESGESLTFLEISVE